MAATPCLKDFFDDEILNTIETEKRIEPVQQPFSMTAILVMEAESIFEPEKMQVEPPVCEPENSACLDDNELELFTGSIRFFCLNGVEYFVVKKYFSCCTGSIRFSVSMALSVSSSKKSFRQGIVKI